LGSSGRDIVAPAASQAKLRSELQPRLVAARGLWVSEEGWELARLRAGIPRYGFDFDEHNYPQEAGLKERAVSFQKGCYLGQEVVCMIEFRGQMTRRLVQLDVDTRDPLAKGSAVAADGHDVGEVTSAQLDPETGRTLALAYVKRKLATPGASPLQVSGAAAQLRSIVGGE
jgi:folate-binding protein YgfZ